LEIIIEIRKEASQVIIKILTRIHYKRVHNKATEYDIYRYNDSKHKRYGISEIYIEIIGKIIGRIIVL
jgi:hypothetical protein